jgi:hypothetical protein
MTRKLFIALSLFTLALIPIAPVSGSLGSTADQASVKGCDDGSPWYKFRRKFSDFEPSRLHSNWVKGPARVMLHRGRSGTSGVTLVNESDQGFSLGVDFKGVQVGWNGSHKDGQHISRSSTRTVSETIVYRVPAGRIARVMYWRTKITFVSSAWKSNPDCDPVRIWRVKLRAPRSEGRWLVDRQFKNETKPRLDPSGARLR